MAFQQGASIQVKNDVPEISTETLGFSALKGESRLQLFPTSWPADNLPQSFSTLLSVASKRGLLAAAGPDCLVVASTAAVYSAFNQSPGPKNVISGFAPDVSISVPRLSHVAFSSDEQHLIITAEQGGGLVVYSVDALLQKNTQPSFQIPTNQLGVRVLAPNPGPGLENYVAIVLESGQLMLADLGQKTAGPVLKDNATCIAWSTRGKNLLAGLRDGTAVQLDLQGQQKALIPRPPGLESSHTVTSIYWPTNDQFFIIYQDPNVPADDDAMEYDHQAKGFFVNTDKGRTTFAFAPFQIECYPALGISRRSVPQYSFLRLRKWPPHLEDMLIISGSNSADTAVITNSSAALGPGAVVDEYALTTLSDSRRAQLPTAVPDADSDSLPIGVAVDLSSKEVVRRPIPGNDEIDSQYPLPSLFMLSHQGILSAWWVVYDASLTKDDGKNQVGYPGLTALSGEQAETPVAKPQPSAFAQATAGPFAAASAPSFGAPGFSNTTTGSGFGKPAFGAPAAPAFGKSSFATSSKTEGFGSGPAFGSTGGLGNRQSPWAAAAGTPQKPVSQPQTQPQQSPFSSLAGSSSGFAKFGSGTGTLGGSTTSLFSSFGASSTGQSAFAAVGKSQQQSVFGSKEPSFGSTVTVGSSLGGSTLPSWQTTPAAGGLSLQPSFTSTRESDMGDEDEDESRKRDEATPTPQVPPQQPKGLFGVPPGGFKLDSSFKGDGSAKDDLPKPRPSTAGSLFGGDFASALTSKPLVPATPIKKEEEELNLRDISTTPASPPKSAPAYLFSSTTPQGPSRTPVKEPVAKERSPVPPSPVSPAIEDAPLPPDPMTWKSKKAEEAEDEHPPLAGSPAIQVEAPDSSVPSSPLDDDDADDDGDISVEEQEDEGEDDDEQEKEEEDDDGDDDDEEDGEEEEPSSSVRRPRAQNSGWKFSDSVSQSPHIPPQAPTPPVKSTATSRSREKSGSPSRLPARPSIFEQPLKSDPLPSLFGKSSGPSTFSKPGPIFPPSAVSRVKENLRSPSPVRSASTSALATRRQHLTQSAPSSASLQPPPKPPTPAPEVSDLSDDDDERIRKELSSEVLPSRDLDGFIAHQDYNGSADKPGIPGQIELVYRDINSMIDTLGLNARSLAAFIKYHETPNRHNELTRNDLDDVVDQGEDGVWYSKWCLAEITDLGTLVSELEKSLDSGKVQDALGKLRQVARVQGEKAKILTKINELRRQISNRKDVEKADTLKLAPLPKEQADQQKALRKEYAKLLTQLADAEEAIIFLKTKLASANAEKGQMKAVPTVDAVKKTINKMIAMTEKKNNDIVLLEAQLRKIGLEPSDRLKSSTRAKGTPGRSSVREQSPFATPASKGKMSIADLNRSVRSPEPEDDTPSKGFGLFYTPPGSPTRTNFNLKIANDMGDEDLEFLKETTKRRKQVADSLRSAVLKRGVKITRMNN